MHLLQLPKALRTRARSDFKQFWSCCRPVAAVADPLQAAGVAGDGSTEGCAAPGREMETVVLLCLLAAVWTSWFWNFLVLWSLFEAVLILRRWEREAAKG